MELNSSYRIQNGILTFKFLIHINSRPSSQRFKPPTQVIVLKKRDILTPNFKFYPLP